ncbi:MAG: GTP-binding protein [Deltaproteobacteria bacterium]|nr:GTP-binding protein [Deltaproteobacteria bacterium]
MAHGDHDSHHHEKGGFESFYFKDQIPLDRKKLIHFLESLPPTLFRLKGWVRFPDASAFLDFTGGRYSPLWAGDVTGQRFSWPWRNVQPRNPISSEKSSFD